MNIVHKLFWGGYCVCGFGFVFLKKRNMDDKNWHDATKPWFSVTGRGVVSFAQKFKEVFKATTEKRLACSGAGPSTEAMLWALQVTSASHTQLTQVWHQHNGGDQDPQHQRDVRLCWGMVITPLHHFWFWHTKSMPLWTGNCQKNYYLLNALLLESQSKADVNLLI